MKYRKNMGYMGSFDNISKAKFYLLNGQYNCLKDENWSLGCRV